MSFLSADAEPLDPLQKTASVALPTLFFYGGGALIAGLTILTHLAQILHLAFKTYFFAALGVCLVAGFFSGFLIKKHGAKITSRDLLILLFLAGMGVAGSGIALLANRPDPDDYYYLPNAVYFMQHPDAPMGFRIQYLFNGNTPLESFAWATSNAYEYIQALMAYALGVHPLTVYYLLMPALAGFLIPFAFFLALVPFSEDPLAAAIGTLTITGVLLLLGETHHTFGNFAFVRIFQGKAVLLSLGFPLFVAFSLRYFARPCWQNWLGVFFLATALTGVSSSALFLLPALALLLLIAYVWTAKPLKWNTAPVYLATLAYVGVLALYTLLFWRTGLDNSSYANQGWPTHFNGHAASFIHPTLPLTPLLALVSTALALFLLPPKRKQFLFAWIAASLVLFLNPLTAKPLIQYVTSANAYWRMFYLYPFPLLAGVAAAALFTHTRRFSAPIRFALVAVVSAALFGAAWLSPTSVFHQEDLQMAWLAYKLPATQLERARNITALAPPGVMLAPQPLAGLVALLDSRFPQMRVRFVAERTWMTTAAAPDEAELRIAASDYLGGNGDDPTALQTLLTRYAQEIRSVVVKESVYDEHPELQALLSAHQFTNQEAINGYIVVWK
jgi:hypothetical protein